MYKLIALYRKPADPQAFERYYAEVHAPLARSIPGLSRLVINRGLTSPRGGESAYYLIAELYFPDEATFETAMASAESRAARDDLRNFAKDIVTVVTVREESSS